MNVAYDELDKMLTVSDIQKHLRMSRKKHINQCLIKEQKVNAVNIFDTIDKDIE